MEGRTFWSLSHEEEDHGENAGKYRALGTPGIVLCDYRERDQNAEDQGNTFNEETLALPVATRAIRRREMM
jgi:hypothetical protein